MTCLKTCFNTTDVDILKKRQVHRQSDGKNKTVAWRSPIFSEIR